MKYTLIIISIIFLGASLRATRKKCLRKLGVLLFVFATGLAGYFLFDKIWVGVLSALLWVFFPWIELLLCVRKTLLPLENKLSKQDLPCESYFPEAAKIKKAFLEKSYEHVTDCGWKWAKSHEHYSFFWHPSKKHLAAICHRVQPCVTFCYLNIVSTTKDGTLWRSSNFPFSPSLPIPPSTRYNHITEGNISCPLQVLYAHELFLYDQGVEPAELINNQFSEVEKVFEHEMRSQIDYNLKHGLIRLTGDGHFKYSFRGLCYLWIQILKDMFRMC